MKQIILFAFATFFTAAAVQAQSPLKIGPSIEVGLPLNTGDVYMMSAGVGINGRYVMPFHKPLEVIVGVSYYRFLQNAENRDAGIKDTQYVPIRVGARYNFPLSFPLYAKLDGGAVVSLQKKTEDYPKEPTGILVSPGVGTSLGPVEVELRYENWTSGTWEGYYGSRPSTDIVGLRFAYFF